MIWRPRTHLRTKFWSRSPANVGRAAHEGNGQLRSCDRARSRCRPNECTILSESAAAADPESTGQHRGPATNPPAIPLTLGTLLCSFPHRQPEAPAARQTRSRGGCSMSTTFSTEIERADAHPSTPGGAAARTSWCRVRFQTRHVVRAFRRAPSSSSQLADGGRHWKALIPRRSADLPRRRPSGPTGSGSR